VVFILMNSTGWAYRTGGFPRGIDFTSDSILVGLSHIAARANRHETTGVVRRFTAGWHHIADYILRGVGMVLAIRRTEWEVGCLSMFERFLDVERIASGHNNLA
jgi:hypothetical protein